MEGGLVVLAALSREAEWEVLGPSKPQSTDGLEPRIRQRNGASEDDDPQRCTHLRREDAPNGELPSDCPHLRFSLSRHSSPCSAARTHCLASGGIGGQQNPVDLPLRLDDANASPTTPQGPHR